MTESFIEKRKRELGLTPSTSSAPSSSVKTKENPTEHDFLTTRKMELGLIPDTRAQDAQTKLTTQYKAATANKNQFYDDNITNAPIIQHNNNTPDVIPTWNGPLDNPIGRTLKKAAGKGLDYGIVKPLDSIYTAAADTLGAAHNLIGGSHKGLDGSIIRPAETHNLGSDLKDIWTNNKTSDHSALEGALPNDFTQKYRLYGSDKTLGDIEDAALQLSVPLPVGKLASGIKGVSSKVGNAFDSLFGKVKPIEVAPVKSPVLGLPSGKSNEDILKMPFQERMKYTDDLPSSNRKQLLLNESPEYNIAQRIKSEQTLSLPEARPSTISDFNRRNGNVQPTNTNPIYGKGDIAEPLGLPTGEYIKPTRLKVNANNETLDYVISKIRPEVIQIIEAPARRDLLVKYIQKNTRIPVTEIHNMPIDTLKKVGKDVQDGLHSNMEQIAAQVAAKYGHDLPALLTGKAPNVGEKIAKDAQSRVYGVPAPEVNIPRPNFNKEVTGQAVAPKQGLSFKREPKAPEAATYVETTAQKAQRIAKQIKDAADRKRISELRKPIIGRAAMPETKIARPPLKGSAATSKANLKTATVVPTNRTTTVLPDEKIKGQQLKDLKTGDETGFAQTVRNSETTPSELARSLNEQSITGSRTTDVLNRQEAAKLIEKHGFEGLHGKLISKTKQFSASETVAAQVLAKHFSSLGGKENLSKAIDLVSKTAKGGREMGQAIQALSQWNKLDSEGALLVGTRQLNKGEKDLTQWKDLTPEQAAPITAATKRIGEAQAAKDLADEVLTIVTNKKAGEALTDAEKATIKEFHAKVKEINEKGKGILSKPKVDKANETIKEVSKIEPKTRTRDQVVSFLDAKAEKARQRISASRNKLSSTPFDIYRDYAIIGASHIAKGVVKLSDFSAAMVRDFGDTVKPHVNDAFNKATNIFRKENGLPTVEHLDRVVNAAVKNERFTPEQASQFKAWASEIGHYADKNLKIEATQDLQRALNDIGTSTLGDKLAATQTASQLLSVPTLVRNVVGNEAFNLVQKINKINAVPIDWAFSKFTGERTLVFHAKNQEKYWDNWVKGASGGWKGVSPNGQFESYGIHPSAFKSNKNPLKYMQKALGAELQSFDHAAYMRAYGRTLSEYAKITGKKIEDLDEAIFDLADEAGRYATFQDDTVLSRLATGTKKALNWPTDKLAEGLVNKGILPEGLSWQGFGTGDLVLKYAKTPANIVMRGIDYSPIGFLRGIGELLPLVTGKTFNQRAATLALSRGITGTLGMTGLGYALISAGVLTGKSSMDADIRSLDQQTGKGEYKVNWSALSRYIEGGLDRDAAKWKKGDNITDWGWLQPMAISISMGVNAQQSVEKQRTEGTSSYVGVAKDALIGSLKTIMQQPLLSGVQNLVSGATNVMRYGSWTGIANIFKGMPSSFVPAALNQARNYLDNTTRNTYDPSTLKEALNMITNKIPGLSKKLPIAYDTLGGKREQIQGGQNKSMEQGIKTFASPVKVTDYVVSPEAKMIMDLINSTGDEKVAPRTPNKYVMVNKKKIELTPKQYSDLQKNTGEATQKALAKIANYLSSDTHADDQKVKKVVDTLNDVGDSVRKQLNKDYPELKPLTAQQLRKQAK